MPIKTAYSQQVDPGQAAEEIAAMLSPDNACAVMFFASSTYAPEAIAAAMSAAFPGTTTFGCTTAGELVDDRMLRGSLVACAFEQNDVVGVSAAFVEDPARDGAVRDALGCLGDEHGPLSALDPTKHLGIVLQDGMRGTEERVMSVLSTVSNVPFVGGSAGDDGAFVRTVGFLDGEARPGAAVLALLHVQRPYTILKTQSFEVLDTVLVPTEVDEASRRVLAFDGRPASEAYADAVGVPVAELSDSFMRHPLGVVLATGEPYVRSPQQIQGTDVVFYCSVKQGMRLHLLKARDIVADTRRDLAAALEAHGECSGILNFHCILRTLELVAKNQCEAYGKLFAGHKTIGLSTYGESYIGHINQTSTMVLFG